MNENAGCENELIKNDRILDKLFFCILYFKREPLLRVNEWSSYEREQMF